ncbi:MAG: tetratricopeptide repeat protein [Roseburia sp.]|nr:tetratricopeptide repeat protein [Roseburia sp.]
MKLNKSRFWFCFAAFLSALSTVFAQTPQNSSDNRYIELISAADSAQSAADWRRADSLLTAAVRLQPQNPLNVLLMSNLGMLRFYQGNDSLALMTLDAAHSMDPRATIVLVNRAKVRLNMGDSDGALADWNAVLEVDTANVATRYLRAMELLRRGDVAAAEADARRLERDVPTDPRTDLALGTLLSSTLRYSEAIPYLNRAIDVDPQSELFAARALCRIMNGDLNEASEDIAEGMRLDPIDGELYLYRALLNRLRYRPDDAKRDARRAVELGVAQRRADAVIAP